MVLVISLILILGLKRLDLAVLEVNCSVLRESAIIPDNYIFKGRSSITADDS